MTLLHIFAMNVKHYRVVQGLSQEKLAELAGLHRTYISSLEREQRNISVDNIQKIATALQIEPYQLFMQQTNSEKE
jgi:transcriptional regulator with XRE-family HTH domain